jgi:3-phenylpropionate/cinnamic acid dioxygenase small subunit
MTSDLSAPVASTALLNAEIQQFYARQMRELDAGRSEEWAATFTVDGVFDAPGHPAPVRGRAALTAGAATAAAEHLERGLVRRHWLGMVDVQPEDDGRLLARSYALVFVTAIGGTTALHRSTVCEDILVREGETWLVQHRRVTRDDLPALPSTS